MSQDTMQAIAVLPQRKEVRLLEHERPRITRDTEVLVRTLDVGICGTDREICTFVYGAPPEGSEYLVLGHESLGRVEAVGDAVKGLKPGDLVVPSVRRPCPHEVCRPCQADRQDFCATGDFTERGIKLNHGFMAQYYAEQERFLNPVPAELRDVAVLAEPLTIAEKGLAQVWATQSRLPWVCTEPGQPRGKGLKAVVLGAGPIGILGAMKCVIEGFDTYVYSRSPAPNPKADLVEALGLPYFSAQEITVEELADKVGHIDLVYEGVGNASASFDVLKVLGHNGVFIFTGIPSPGGETVISGNDIMRNLTLKNQAIIGTVNADRQAFQDAITDLGRFQQRWPELVRALISKRWEIDDYSELLLGRNTGIKNVIRFAED